MFVIVKSAEHKVDAKGKRFPGRNEAALIDAFPDRGADHSEDCSRMSSEKLSRMVGDGSLAERAPVCVRHRRSHSISSMSKLPFCTTSAPSSTGTASREV